MGIGGPFAKLKDTYDKSSIQIALQNGLSDPFHDTIGAKKKIEYEKYVDLQGNFALRRNITKIRTSSHKLEIEAGRYLKNSNKTKTESKKRLCKNCDLGEIEDEAHAITCCPKYEADRRNILVTLTEVFPFLEHWS